MGLNLGFKETKEYFSVANCADMRQKIHQYTLYSPQDFSLPESLSSVVDSQSNHDGSLSCKAFTAHTFKADSLNQTLLTDLKGIAPILDEDNDEDCELHISTSNEWYSDLSNNWDAHCKGCALCPNDNFIGCYPRMGSYGYVASLSDFCEEYAAGSPEIASLISEPFVVATSSGGYRIGDFDGDRRAHYESHLRSISNVREVLSELTTEAALCFHEGVKVNDMSYGAGPQNSSFGYNWAMAMSGVCWGFHAHKGIAMITDNESTSGFLKKNQSVKYFKSAKAGDDICTLTAFDGSTIEIPREKSPISGMSFLNQAFDELVWGNVPALDKFSHLLDTAETMISMALKHNLVVEER